jgi:hypothetical protein
LKYKSFFKKTIMSSPVDSRDGSALQSAAKAASYNVVLQVCPHYHHHGYYVHQSIHPVLSLAATVPR